MDENRCIALIKDIYKLGIPNNITLAGNDIKEAKESIEAFYNSNGGIIIFGIDKDLKQIKINTKTIIETLKTYNDNLTSSNPLVYKSFKYNNKDTILFKIRELPLEYKPTHNIKLNDIDSKIRIKDKNEKISYSKLYSLYAFKGINEEELSKSYLYDDKYNDMELFNNFILKYRELNRTIESLATESIVSYLRLINDSYKTLAYVLTFSTYPQIFYPYLYIAIYKLTPNNDYILQEKIDGSISTMYLKTMLIIKKHLNYELSFVDGKLNTNTTFPISAIEEALFNALTLRDYSPYGIVTPIKIYLSNNIIKIANPGSYIYDDTFISPPEKLIRNPLIKQMNGIILGRDNLNNGFNRIFNILKISGYKPPIIESYDNTFSITLTNESIIHIYNGINIDELSKYCLTPRSKEEIYNYLRPNKKSKDYSFMVRKYIYPLIELNILEYTIPNKPQSRNQKFKTTKNYLENIKYLNLEGDENNA